MSQMNYEINHKITLQKGLCSMKLPKYFLVQVQVQVPTVNGTLLSLL